MTSFRDLLDRNRGVGPGFHFMRHMLAAAIVLFHIGNRSVISQGAYLCASTHDIRDPLFQLVLRPIVIGRQCWVAADAFVGPGVTMGDEAVLGARAALFGDAEAGWVYSGNPAVAIKQRNLRKG